MQGSLREGMAKLNEVELTDCRNVMTYESMVCKDQKNSH